MLLPANCATRWLNPAIAIVLGYYLTLVGCAIARHWFKLILKK
ncbi:hypothetical protein [Nostoc sp. PA-18-2419]|nr:hypothetical protein [Nostoc sp. PA-18-2419]